MDVSPSLSDLTLPINSYSPDSEMHVFSPEQIVSMLIQTAIVISSNDFKSMGCEDKVDKLTAVMSKFHFLFDPNLFQDMFIDDNE